jgi:hypothetical protein
MSRSHAVLRNYRRLFGTPPIQKAKQPYAIAMNDGKPFGIGGLWEKCLVAFKFLMEPVRQPAA